MNGHTLGQMSAGPRFGALTLPRWMGKVGAKCECGTDVVGDSPGAVVASWRKHCEAVAKRVLGEHRPLEWVGERLVCGLCLPLADWPCDPAREALEEQR